MSSHSFNLVIGVRIIKDLSPRTFNFNSLSLTEYKEGPHLGFIFSTSSIIMDLNQGALSRYFESCFFWAQSVFNLYQTTEFPLSKFR